MIISKANTLRFYRDYSAIQISGLLETGKKYKITKYIGDVQITDESFNSSFDIAIQLANTYIEALSVIVTTTDSLTTFVEGTDYTIDYTAGTITVLSTGTMLDATNYFISYKTGDDFTNIGAASNATGIIFTATGTTPNEWTNGSSILIQGVILENYSNTTINKMFNLFGYVFSQRFIIGDIIPIQIYIGTDPVPIVTFEYDNGNIDTLSSSYIDGYYYTYMYTYQGSGRLKIVGTGIFYSEHIETTTSENIKIEWYNFDDAFAFHYRSEIINFMRIDGVLKNIGAKGKVKVFNNQNEETKIRETLWRTVNFIPEPLPAMIAEVLTIAAAHDVFVINDVEYVTSAIPGSKQMGNSTLYEIIVKLTERSALGTNRHDTGSSSGIIPGAPGTGIGDNYVGTPSGLIYVV